MHIFHDHLSLHTYILCPISLSPSKILAALSVHANNPDIRLNCLNETLFFPFLVVQAIQLLRYFFFFLFLLSIQNRSSSSYRMSANRIMTLRRNVSVHLNPRQSLHSYNRRRYYERNFKEPRACLRNDSPSKMEKMELLFHDLP